MNAFLSRLDLFFQRSQVRHFFGVLFLVSAFVFSILPFVRFLRTGTEMDYRTWFDAGQVFLQDQILYPKNNAFPFMYPPTCALFLGLASIFGKAPMILILGLINSVAWVVCVKLTGVLITRNALKRVLPVVFSNFVLLVFVWSSYHLGQPSLILLAFMLGAFVCLQRDRQIVAGTLIALAAAIKAFPALALIYLIYRRYWAAASAFVIALAFILVVLPIPFRGVRQSAADLRDWGHGMLSYRESGIAQRPARSYSWKNQSAFGLANRLLRFVSAEDEGKPAIYANIADLDFAKVNLVLGIFALIAGLSFIFVLPGNRNLRAARSPPESSLWHDAATGGRDAHPSRETRVAGLEFSALLILILIFTPLAFGYLFSWLMLPIAALTRRILDGDSGLSFLIAALLSLTATAIAPRFAQIYGSIFFASIALYLGVALALTKSRSV